MVVMYHHSIHFDYRPMTSRFFIRTAALCAFALANLFISTAAEPAAETAKIEALLTKLGALDGAVFIRNGTEYDAKQAVKFLRGKWESHHTEISTVDDFITKVASFSSTSGKPYVIRMKDGVETPSADYLKKALSLLAAPTLGK